MPASIHRYIRSVAGFTLHELLIVTMILSVLILVASPTIMAYFERVRVARGLSVARTVQASLASFMTTDDSYQYPAAIGSYEDLKVLINTNGGQLKDTEGELGMIFQQYTALDSDGDTVLDSYTMSFRVTNVSPKRPGWCITIQPSGVARCPPQ